MLKVGLRVWSLGTRVVSNFSKKISTFFWNFSNPFEVKSFFDQFLKR